MTNPPRNTHYGKAEGFSDPDEDGWQLFLLSDSPWDISVRVERVRGIPEVTSLKLEPNGPLGPWLDPQHYNPEREEPVHPKGILGLAGNEVLAERSSDAVITGEKLRRLPIRMLRGAAEALLGGGPDVARKRLRTSRRGPKWHREHFVEVAEVYRDAADRGWPPRDEISLAWGVSAATASKWIRQARTLGVLGWPEAPGKPGYTAKHSPITGKKQRKAT